jgi:hypothetical protein
MIKFNFSKKGFYFKNKAKFPKETKEQASKEKHEVLKAKNKSMQNKKQRKLELCKQTKGQMTSNDIITTS